MSEQTEILETPTEVEPVAAGAWRGVAKEDDTVDDAAGLVLARRSRQLLYSLVRPYRRVALGALLFIIADNATQVSLPLFVAYGLDTGVGHALRGEWLPVVYATCGYL